MTEDQIIFALIIVSWIGLLHVTDKSWEVIDKKIKEEQEDIDRGE